MTDKKKKRARSISQKTGMTHQAAVNVLNTIAGNSSPDVVTVDMHPNKVRILLNGEILSGVTDLNLSADSSGHQLINLKMVVWDERSREIVARLKKVPYVSVEEFVVSESSQSEVQMVRLSDFESKLLQRGFSLGLKQLVGQINPEGKDLSKFSFDMSLEFSDGSKVRSRPEGSFTKTVPEGEIWQEDFLMVSVTYSEEGVEGPGWYVWESKYPDKGFVLFSTTEPTLADIHAICPTYIVKESYPPNLPVPKRGRYNSIADFLRSIEQHTLRTGHHVLPADTLDGKPSFGYVCQGQHADGTECGYSWIVPVEELKGLPNQPEWERVRELLKSEAGRTKLTAVLNRTSKSEPTS